MRYFTSDLHLNSNTINKYADRPFKDAFESSTHFITSISRKCKESDILFHVGDFVLTSPDRHGVTEDIPLDISAKDWMDQIVPRLVLIEGNHDNGHNVITDAKCLVIDLNGFYRDVTVGHYPSSEVNQKKYLGKYGTDIGRMHIHLCGHVHNSWLIQYDYQHNVLNINVGVDVWNNYSPVSTTELINLLDFIRHNNKEFFIKRTSWSLTRKDFDIKYNQITNKIKLLSKERREQKKLAKGLTPEECERRRQEGILKSKLKKANKKEN